MANRLSLTGRMEEKSFLTRDLFEGMMILTLPCKEQLAQVATESASPKNILEASLMSSMKALHQALGDSTIFKSPSAILGDKEASLRSMVQQGTEDMKWLYVEHCLTLLQNLRSCLHDAMQTYENECRGSQGNAKAILTPNMAPSASPDTLSFSQQTVLSTLSQFITSLGICPALLKGVGLPLSIRSRLAASTIPSDKPLLFKERQRRLMVILQIYAACIRQPTVGGFLLSKSLNDLMSMMIQLVSTQEIQKTIKIKKPDGTIVSPAEGEPALSSTDIHFAKTQLDHLICHCYQPSIIKELLILQGGMGSGVQNQTPLPKPPQWLRRMCGKLLAERLIADKGVAHFLQGVIDDGDTSSGVWSRCDAMANLLATPPSPAVQKEVYYQRICHQMFDILHAGDDLTMKQVVRVISSFVVAIVTKERVLAKHFILDPLFKPFTKATDAQGDDQCAVASESELSQCISDIYKVFIIGREPSSALLSCLTPVLHHLFSLYCFCMEGVCNLRAFVEEILCAYIRTADFRTALTTLNHISAIKTSAAYGRMKEKVTFTPGSSGGANMIYQGNASIEEVFTQNLMRHEHVGRCCTALLQKVSQEKLSADFFIVVLNEMTVAVTSLDNLDSLVEQNSGSAASKHSKELLDLEPSSQMHRINTVQHALRVLAILEQLCEAFGPDILKETCHLLQFCQAALQRCVDRLKREGDDAVDHIPGVLETETLTLAVALLSAVTIGERKKKFTAAERQILQGMLPLLTTISNLHPLESIQKLADDLAVAIATHGAVSSSSISQAGEDLRRNVKQNDIWDVGVGKGCAKNQTRTELLKHKTPCLNEGDVGNTSCGANVAKMSSIAMNNGMKIHDQSAKEEFQSISTSSEMSANTPSEKCSHEKQNENSSSNNPLRSSEIASSKSRHKPSSTTGDDRNVERNPDMSEQGELHDINKHCENSKSGTALRTAHKENMKEIVGENSKKSKITLKTHKDSTIQHGELDTNHSEEEKPRSAAFEEAMQDLVDPLLPVRGHALIILTRLIKDKDRRAIAESDSLLKIFEEHLSDDDTFIYLPSINGLVALAGSHPDRVVPHLCNAFTSGHAEDTSKKWSGTSKMSLEKTLKIGEALVKATQQLGELVPHYRGLLLNTIMAATKHPDCHLRASSLAHLGEVCRLLRYSLGHVVHEVLTCITNAIKNDPDIEVKRSAVQVMNLLLRGLGKDAIQVLDTSIRDIYHCLKRIGTMEKDAVLLLHAQLALEELDIIMRQYLFPKQTLTKKITVLNP